MQTVGLFQTFRNYLFLRRLMCVAREGVGGSRAGPGPITGVETEAEAQPGPRDSRRRHMGKGEGCVFWGWLFEQVEGISNTVNTGELDKTVLT